MQEINRGKTSEFKLEEDSSAEFKIPKAYLSNLIYLAYNQNLIFRLSIILKTKSTPLFRLISWLPYLCLVQSPCVSDHNRPSSRQKPKFE